MYQEGDVLIVPVAREAVRSTWRTGSRKRRDERARLTLALGEVTGNAHAVVRPGELVREPGPLHPLPRHLPKGGRVVHGRRLPR